MSQTLLALAGGLRAALTPEHLLWSLAGAMLGTLVGVLPGIGPALTVALLLPLTLGLEPTNAFIMFGGIYYGAMYGGSTATILLNTPGESATIVSYGPVSQPQPWVAGVHFPGFKAAIATKLTIIANCDTEAEQAKRIVERLRNVVGDEPGCESILVGVSSQKPGQGTVDSIVHDAHANALAGTHRRRAADSPHGVNR